MVNIFQWDAQKLCERRESLLDADRQKHERDDALDFLVERSDMTVEDMTELASNINKHELFSLLTTPN